MNSKLDRCFGGAKHVRRLGDAEPGNLGELNGLAISLGEHVERSFERRGQVCRNGSVFGFGLRQVAVEAEIFSTTARMSPLVQKTAACNRKHPRQHWRAAQIAAPRAMNLGKRHLQQVFGAFTLPCKAE